MNTDNLNSDSMFPAAGKVNFSALNAKNDFATIESFKSLRSNVLFSGADIKTILITSTCASEGKSTVSLELAKSFSEIDKKTLLLDADMRRSVFLPRNLKTQNILGLSELLSGQASINQTVFNTSVNNLDIIFSGHFPPNPVELLNSKLFAEKLEQLKSVYDCIIIDSPPLGIVIDAAIIAAKCDASILVVSPGKSKIKDTISVKEQLLKSGSRILGAVINETNSRHKDLNGSYQRNYYYNDK